MITLVFRLLLFALAVFLYMYDPSETVLYSIGWYILREVVLLAIIWLHLVVGMMFRLIPNKRISMGARKHFFETNLKSSLAHPKEKIKTNIHKGAATIAIVWIVLNAFVFMLMHLAGLLTLEIAVIILLSYSICDVAFIQFSCPFRFLFMHNRCCTTCRIYNWDFLMITTPLILFPSLFSLSLLTLALAVFIRWEFAVWRYPERFAIETNPGLCASCNHCNAKV